MFSVLKGNGYPKRPFIAVANQSLLSVTLTGDEVSTAAFAVVPYIRGVTEPIKRILASHNVKVAQKPFQTLRHVFCRPKDRVPRGQRTDSVYSIHCKDCEHVYKGQSKRTFVGTCLPN